MSKQSYDDLDKALYGIIAVMLSGLFYSLYTTFLSRDVFMVKTELEMKVDEGKAWSSSKRFTLNSGESKQVVLINNSGKNIKVVAIEVSSEGNADLDIYSDVTVEAQGDAWVISNLNLASDYMIDVRIEDGGTYSGGTKRLETIAYGGAKQFAVGSLSEIGEGIILPSGRNIMVVVTNTTTQSIKISIRFLFYEK